MVGLKYHDVCARLGKCGELISEELVVVEAQDTWNRFERKPRCILTFLRCFSDMSGEGHPCAPLPKTDAYVRLSLLDGGSFIGDYSILHAGVSEEKFRMYDWAFHINHKNRHVLWDLGMDGVRT